MPVSKETIKGIETALQLEKKSYAYYHKKYKQLKEHIFRNLLLFLARQESDHINHIEKLKKSLMKKRVWSEVKAESKRSRFFKPIKKINHTSHEIEILHVAMEFEKRTREFYAKQEKKTKEPEVKRFFKKMTKFEDAHYKLLDGMYESFMYVRLET